MPQITIEQGEIETLINRTDAQSDDRFFVSTDERIELDHVRNRVRGSSRVITPDEPADIEPLGTEVYAHAPDGDATVNVDRQGFLLSLFAPRSIETDITASSIGNVPVDVNAVGVGQVPIDIEAATLGSLGIDIEAQTLANLGIDVQAQTLSNLDIFDTTNYAQVNSTATTSYPISVDESWTIKELIVFDMPLDKTMDITAEGGASTFGVQPRRTGFVLDSIQIDSFTVNDPQGSGETTSMLWTGE